MTQTSTNELNDRHEYRDAIKTMADEIEQHIEDYPEDSEDIHQLVHEDVDSSAYIIYYGYNLDVLQYAENEPHEWRSFVREDAGYRDVLQAMAFEAMRWDLIDELRERGVEL